MDNKKIITILLIVIICLAVISLGWWYFVSQREVAPEPTPAEVEVEEEPDFFTYSGVELLREDGYELTKEEKERIGIPYRNIAKVKLVPSEVYPDQSIPTLEFTVSPDTDEDGALDIREKEWGTDINNPDTDGDGVVDGFEILSGLGMDPLNPDTDGDGISDGDELQNGTNPSGPGELNLEQFE